MFKKLYFYKYMYIYTWGPNGSQRGAIMERKGAKGIPKGPKWESNGSKGDQRGARRKPWEPKWEPKEYQNEARGAKRNLNHVDSF